MARNYKDHFGNATREIERTLKNAQHHPEPVKDTEYSHWKWQLEQAVIYDKSESLDLKTYGNLSIKYEKEIRKFYEQKASFSTVINFLAKIEEEVPRRTGILDRELWLKNKAIIEAKAAKTYEKPGREPKEPKTPKVVEISKAMYGLEDIKLIDVTSKIKVGEKFNNELAGEDPCPKKKKNVIVTATVDGIEGEYTFIEGKKIQF